MPLWQQILVAVAVPLAAGLAAYANGRAGRKDSLVDQLQEEIKRLDDKLNKESEDRIAGEARLNKRLRGQEDYIAALRQHIADGLGPPPPPWPDYLR